MNRLRYWTVVALFAAAALILYTRGAPEVVPLREPLAQVPRAIAEWTGHDVAIAPEEKSLLRGGEFLSRVYRRNGLAPIGLWIGYFPSQRTGETIHSPRNCLPGAGWLFTSSQYVHLRDPEGKTHQVGEYVLTRGEYRQFAIYWYQAHGRSVASEYSAKFFLVADALRWNRTDGALVRVVTPLLGGENEAAAQARAEQFTGQLFPLLPRFIPN